jgi:hypothetical protein
MLRKLRIAFSVICGILCLLLVVLWVRSYWWLDNFIGPLRGSVRYGVASGSGWLTVRYGNGKMDPQSFPEWTWQCRTVAEMEAVYKQMEESIQGTTAKFTRPTFEFGWKEDWGFQFPYWMPTVLVGILAVAASWRRPWRFSLRTLLIAMTLCALGLGAIVWAVR